MNKQNRIKQSRPLYTFCQTLNTRQLTNMMCPVLNLIFSLIGKRQFINVSHKWSTIIAFIVNCQFLTYITEVIPMFYSVSSHVYPLFYTNNLRTRYKWVDKIEQNVPGWMTVYKQRVCTESDSVGTSESHVVTHWFMNHPVRTLCVIKNIQPMTS